MNEYFQTSGFLLRRGSHPKFSIIDIAFDQTVTVEEYVFPEFLMESFLSSVGGSLGLWLGVGVIQIGGYGGELFAKIKSYFVKENNRM